MSEKLDSLRTYIIGACGFCASVTLSDVNEVLNFTIGMLSLWLVVRRLVHDIKHSKKS